MGGIKPKRLPQEVQTHIGYALYIAQQGGKYRDVKPLKGFSGANVLEIVTDYRTDTYRCVYTVRFGDSVFVLHVFQKKSKTGRATPRLEMELIERRARDAQRIAQEQET